MKDDMWIVLILVCFLQSVWSQECSTYEKIIRRLGEDVRLNISLSDIRDEYNTLYNGTAEIDVETLNDDLEIIFDRSNVTREFILYNEGNQTSLAIKNGYEISSENDTIMVKINRLEIQHAGLYWANFRFYRYGKKRLILARKPKIIPNDPPNNPVLKPEDNFQTTIQLECQGQSTNVGLCQNNNSIFIIWYKNGVRMVTPTLNSTGINVTVGHDGADYTCLVTSYPPCYQRLQTTTNYDNVLKIEVCEDVSGNWTFKIRPLYAPNDVKQEPDLREIIREKESELKVTCSARCQPECQVTWKKDFQELVSGSSVVITGNKLKISNLNSSHEGFYSCLMNNSHGEDERNFSLVIIDAKVASFHSRREDNLTLISSKENNENRELIPEDKNHTIVAVTVVVVVIIAVIVIVTIFVMYKKYRKERNDYKIIQLKISDNVVSRDQSHSEEEEGIFETMDLYQGAPLTKNKYGIQNRMSENLKYAELEFPGRPSNTIHGCKPDPEVIYGTIDFTKKAPPMPKQIELDSDEGEWT